jgi:hypothetical protein
MVVVVLHAPAVQFTTSVVVVVVVDVLPSGLVTVEVVTTGGRVSVVVPAFTHTLCPFTVPRTCPDGHD